MRFIKQLKKHSYLFFLATGIDFLFFVLLAQLQFYTFLSVADHMKQASTMLTRSVEKLSIPNIEQLDILQDQTFIIHYHAVLQGILLFLLGFFILWTILRGITWFLTHKIIETKVSVKQFFIRFTSVTIIGGILTIVLLLGFLLLIDYANFSILPFITPSMAHILSFVLLLTLHYTYSLVIASINNLGHFTKALNTRTVIIYLASILWYIIATSTTMFLSYQSFTLGIIAVVIIMPTLTISRVLLIKHAN